MRLRQATRADPAVEADTQEDEEAGVEESDGVEEVVVRWVGGRVVGGEEGAGEGEEAGAEGCEDEDGGHVGW